MTDDKKHVIEAIRNFLKSVNEMDEERVVQKERLGENKFDELRESFYELKNAAELLGQCDFARLPTSALEKLRAANAEIVSAIQKIDYFKAGTDGNARLNLVNNLKSSIQQFHDAAHPIFATNAQHASENKTRLLAESQKNLAEKQAIIDKLQQSAGANQSLKTAEATAVVKPNSISATPRTLRPGMEVDAYRLIERLGRGYSAEVWKATLTRPVAGVELSPATDVAVKFYNPSMFEGMQTMRIQREFSIATNAIHENLAQVFDLVLSPSRPFHSFMVMEYVPGNTLKKHIERNGKLSMEEIIEIGGQLFSALDELHRNDAIHRDVKAANIILPNYTTSRPNIKLVDLGIVAMQHEDRFTNPSAFLGSKHSAPLEQLKGEEVNERADIYGAGSVLFHCLTGAPMYAGAGPEGAIVWRMLNAPERLEDFGRDPLREFINRCISTEAKDRPGSARECLEEIRGLARGSGGTGKVPRLLVGEWDHQWDPGLTARGHVKISPDGSYVVQQRGIGTKQFRLENAVRILTQRAKLDLT